jgi:hypothetical protein
MTNYRQQFIKFNAALALLLGIIILPNVPSRASDITETLGADLNWRCGELQPSLRVFPEAGNREIRMNFLPCDKQAPSPQNNVAPQSQTSAIPGQGDVTQLSQQLIQQGIQLLKVGQPIIQQVLQQVSQPTQPPAPQNVQR